MPGNVQTRICVVTAQHSLVPTSYALTTIGRLCSLLSPKGAIRDSHVPLAEVRRVRRLLSTGRVMGHERAPSRRCSHLRCHFGPSVTATSACFGSRSLSQIHMCSPYQLSSTYPAYGCQKGTPLAIDTPHLVGASLRCQGRSLFRPLDSSGDTDGSLLS